MLHKIVVFPVEEVGDTFEAGMGHRGKFRSRMASCAGIAALLEYHFFGN